MPFRRLPVECHAIKHWSALVALPSRAGGELWLLATATQLASLAGPSRVNTPPFQTPSSRGRPSAYTMTPGPCMVDRDHSPVKQNTSANIDTHSTYTHIARGTVVQRCKMHMCVMLARTCMVIETKQTSIQKKTQKQLIVQLLPTYVVLIVGPHMRANTMTGA